MLREMAFIYAFALFDAFLADAHYVFLLARPEALKSGRQMTHEQIIERIVEDDLIESLARREVDDLAYKSVAGQFSYYKEKIGLRLSKSGVDVKELVEMRARRNLFVHNGGVATSTLLK